ncbi:MAG: ATP-dependent RecD-like DNA helicase [Lachnospirales bacterium]
MENLELEITGTVDCIIYKNDENSYYVFKIIDEYQEEVICVAYSATIKAGDYITLYGNFITHKQYGEQFKVSKLLKILPSTTKGIENYLASGAIKGIGKATAKKIVKKFQEDTLIVIEQEFEKLTLIKGISRDKAFSIHNQFVDQNVEHQVYLFLAEYNISPAYSSKIYKKYKQRTIDVIQRNPYLLCQDVSGISFTFADNIAMQSGISTTSIFRLKSGVLYALNRIVYTGNVYCLKDELVLETRKLLNVDDEHIENAFVELQKENSISQVNLNDEIVIYPTIYLYAENYIAKKLVELNSLFGEKEDNNLTIKKVEKENDITLAKEQYNAVIQALEHGVLVITGGPGTGKTTTVRTIIDVLETLGNEVLLCAPTGRAAKRLSEATDKQASTIHRLLGGNAGLGNNFNFEKNEENPLECDVLVVDEASMIDTLLMMNLLKAVDTGTRLILVGDVDQLPSVSAGNVLRDIISSDTMPVIMLKEIFRQAKESDIVVNAHKINVGEYPVLKNDSKDFFFVNRQNIDEVATTICDLLVNRLPKYMNCNKLTDIQVLTPMKKSAIGVRNLNELLQNVLNPPSSLKKERDFKGGKLRVGDKVMQVKNNYTIDALIKDKRGKLLGNTTGVYNGDEGYVTKIDTFNEYVEVCFDGNKYIQYEYSLLEEIDLAYAITVHKSQGSEYPVVVMPIHSGPPILLSRNLLYTGVTRGKQLVVLVGVEETIHSMINNDKEIKRNSTLDKYLRDIDTLLSTRNTYENP